MQIRFAAPQLAIRFFASVVLLSSGPLTASAQRKPDPSTAPPAAAELTKKVDELFSGWDKDDTPGCALAVVDGGRIVYSRGYGVANLEHGVRITPDTVFNVASMSKQFTAASIALLARQGRLSLGDGVRRYVPELPAYTQPITIRQLVYHSSGLRDYTDLIELSDDRIENVHTDGDILDILRRQKGLNFKPGERFLYSNSGYVLLGIVVERVTGKTLRAFEEEFIFRPLGMSHSSLYDDRTMIVKNRAGGYWPAEGGGYRARASLWDRVGDGGMLTTVGDLALWDQNFYAPKVGDAGLIDLLTAPGTLEGGQRVPYAFGLEPSRYKGLPVLTHGGSVRGFRAQMYRFPEQRFSVVCLCNNGGISPTSMVEKVSDIYLAGRFKPDAPAAPPRRGGARAPGTVTLTEEELARFAGTYAASPGEFARRLYVKGGKLRYVIGEREDYELAPLGGGRFAVLGVPENIEVLVDAGGEGAPSRMSQIVDGGKPTVYEAVEPADESPARLREYAGSYYSEELDTKYDLSLVGAKLAVKKKTGDSLTLSPQFADVFGDWDGLISARFVREPRGRVTGFLLSTSRMKGIAFKKL